MKCHRYWPSQFRETYGNLQVTLKDKTSINPNIFTVRTFKLHVSTCILVRCAYNCFWSACINGCWVTFIDYLKKVLDKQWHLGLIFTHIAINFNKLRNMTKKSLIYQAKNYTTHIFLQHLLLLSLVWESIFYIADSNFN